MLTKTPGSAVVYLWYLQYWSKKHGVTDLNLSYLCERVFPMGFFSEDDIHKVWDAQKVNARPDNLFDYQLAGLSLLV